MDIEMTHDQFRDVLLRMVDEQENVITENLALKAVLTGEVPAEHEPQVQVQGVVDAMRSGGFHSPEFDAFRRSQDDLRRRIQQAAEDRQLVELFRQFPPGGEPN